jgi:hypothetical protein
LSVRLTRRDQVELLFRAGTGKHVCSSDLAEIDGFVSELSTRDRIFARVDVKISRNRRRGW